MKTNSKSTSKKQATKKPSANSRAKETSAPIAAAQTAAVPTVIDGYKVWRIKELSDIAAVDEWQMDKCLHFLSHLIRKCRIMKRRLIEFTYYEQGRISYVMQDIETGEIIAEPKEVKAEIEEDDPLA